MMQVFVRLVILPWHICLAFNIDTESWLTFSAPANVDPPISLFGHSVALGKDVAFVGAPKHDTSGGVFKSPFHAKSRFGETTGLNSTEIKNSELT